MTKLLKRKTYGILDKILKLKKIQTKA